MSVAVRLRRVEQQDMVGIGEHGLPLLRAPKHTPAHEHDAVRRVRLLSAIGGDVRVALEIDDGDAERYKQAPSRVLCDGRCARKKLQAAGRVHTSNTYGAKGGNTMRSFANVSQWVAAAAAVAAMLAWAHKPRTDPGGDMIAALAARGPHPSLGHHADVFGRLVGTWDADYSFIAEDGSVRHSRGEVLFGWILDGYALQDIF